MKSLSAARHYGYVAPYTRLRTPRSVAQASIRVLGSLSLVLAGFSAATPAAENTEDLSAPGHGSESYLRTAYEGASQASDRLPRIRRPGAPRDHHDAEDVDAFEGLLKFDGELELIGQKLKNIALGQRPDDDVRNSDQEIAMALSYRPSERLSAFGEMKFVAEQEVRADATPRISEEAVERGETWLYFKRIFGSDYALKIGRQSFFEPRRWWWDEELDAVRLYHARDPWRFYVGFAEELGRTSSRDDFIDPEVEDVQRLIGHVNWALSERLDFAAFYLGQRDNSKTSSVGSVIETVREDESDADLHWAGLRAAGEIALSGSHGLSYWADTAVVKGDETLLEFEDAGQGLSHVNSIQKRRVRGWAVDLGAIWTLPLQRKPAMTLNYAYGSGDKDLNDDTDRAFRQTGLQDTGEEFRHYGELLRPELSNLRVATAAVGFRVFADSRLTLGYHHFRQVYAAPFLRDARIELEPTGKNKDIGRELSLLVELREWEDLQIDLAAGVFEAGSAYGVASGERATSLFFKLIYEF